MKKQFFAYLFLMVSSIVPAQDVKTRAEAFVKHLSRSEFKESYSFFDSTVVRQLTIENLGLTWNMLLNQVGNFLSYSNVQVESKESQSVALILCQFEKADLDLKIAFNKENKVVGFFFIPPRSLSKYIIPTYDHPDSYKEINTIIQSGHYKLPAILTIPVNVKKAPVLILLHGSGPMDKDATVGPTKIFRDLAVGLASQGIASIRYDKRTNVYANELVKDQKKITVKEEFIEDAVSAIESVKKFPELDNNRIYLLGHSQGGMIAPQIAGQSKNLKGLILLAANSRPLEDLILEQTKYILSLDSLTKEEIGQIQVLEQQVINVKSSGLSLETPQENLPLTIPAAYWLDLRDYKPALTTSQLKLPILILQGERDYQVTMTDFLIWKNQLSGKKNVAFRSFSKLNHLFIEGEGASTPAEYQFPGSFSPEVISFLQEWIVKN